MRLFSRFRSKPSMAKSAGTPFPTRTLFILALCRVCEPIAFTSIFPYIYFMVKSFGVTTDEKRIAIYAGMVTSVFAIAEFSASIFWGWLSDRIGRKPVLLTGLAGTGISMLAFGFAPNLPIALLARSLGGLLNGNIGVILTTVGEVVTDDAHQSRAFAIMPFVWCLGSIIGASIGGSLADPVKNYPTLFNADGIFGRFPYLLPNIVCTAVVLFGLIVGFLFLEETHQDKQAQKDSGLALGRWIISVFSCSRAQPASTESLIADDPIFNAVDEKGDYHVIPSSPQMFASAATSLNLSSTTEVIDVPVAVKLSVRHSLTKQVKLIILSYGLLAFHTISLEQLLPVLFATPESQSAPVLPFKFDGGFSLSTKTIGIILSSQGILQMIAQIIIFPFVSERYGSLTTFRIAVLSYPLLYILIPYLALVPHSLRYPCIVLVLVWKVTAQSFSFPSQSIMLANSAPSKRVLGTLNGIAMSSASLARALGPTFIGFVHATGRHMGYSIFSWWSCALVACVGAIVSLSMREPQRNVTSVVVSPEELDEEKAEAQPLLLGRLSDEVPSESSLVDEPLH